MILLRSAATLRLLARHQQEQPFGEAALQRLSRQDYTIAYSRSQEAQVFENKAIELEQARQVLILQSILFSVLMVYV